MSKFLYAASQVEAYWRALYDNTTIPKRSEIDPRGMEHNLEFAFVLEVVAPGVARIRVAGMHLNDLMGMEVRGMPITAFFTPDARAKVAEGIRRVAEGTQLADFALLAAGGPGKEPLDGRMFLAPLLDDAGQPTRILGCLQTNGHIGRTPRRFDSARLSLRALDEPRRLQEPRIRQIAFAEEAAAFTGPAPKAIARKSGHLTLVYSSD